MSGVDQLDRSNAEWGMTRRTSRYYLRIAFWLFDTAVHNIWVIIQFCAEAARVATDPFFRFKHKNSRREYQLELSQTLIAEGIKIGIAENGGEKPAWMRQVALVPCNCKTCYFCRSNADVKASTSPAENVQGECEKNEKVKLGKSAGRCVICVRAATSKYPTYTQTQLARTGEIKQTCYGCTGCTTRVGSKVFICDKHWPKYKHDFVPLSSRRVAKRIQCGVADCVQVLDEDDKFCRQCGVPC